MSNYYSCHWCMYQLGRLLQWRASSCRTDDVRPGGGRVGNSDRGVPWLNLVAGLQPPPSEAGQHLSMDPQSCGGGAKASRGLFHHQVCLLISTHPMTAFSSTYQQMNNIPLKIQIAGVFLFLRQHGVDLGEPGQALGLVEMELREDIVSTFLATFIKLVFNVCFLHKIRFRKPAKISLPSALGAQDMDIVGPHFTGKLSTCRKKSIWFFAG